MFGSLQAIASSPPGGPQALDRAHQHAERGRVDEGRVREVDEHAARAALDRLEQRLLQGGSRRQVDLTGDRDRGDAAAEVRSRELELHPRTEITPYGASPNPGVG